MTPDQLGREVEGDAIDTVIVAFTDHFGRLMGKRFDAQFFLESIDDGTHACNYLLTVDMDMEPVQGFESANWQSGYGDFHLLPDLATLRRCGWSPRSAIVLCDVVGREGEEAGDHTLVSVAPRSVLRNRLEAATDAGFEVKAASELEFFLYRDSYRNAHAKGYSGLTGAGWYNEDYHLLQGGRVEDYVGAARRALRNSEIPVENSKGEAAIGQHELNIRYADVLAMADRHVLMKHGMKELAEQQGVAVTFMAKPESDKSGNSCHIHLSLWSGDAGARSRNLFDDDGRRSDLFRWFLGGWMHHAQDLMLCYAPTVNSYKRFQSRSWAPTRIAWSTDNRTTGFRIVGAGQSLRIECRIPGGDVNPYLAYAAAVASGLHGIANRIEPPPEFAGDAYTSDLPPPVPTTLGAAIDRFSTSDSARRLLGDDVVDHYSHHAAGELAAYEAAVTDWERHRYFERI